MTTAGILTPGRSRPIDPRATLLKLAGAGRHPRQRAGLQAFQGRRSLNGVDADTWTRSLLRRRELQRSTDSTDLASLDVNGNPIQASSAQRTANRVRPLEPQRPARTGAGPTP